MGRRLLPALAAAALCSLPIAAAAEVVTRLPTTDKVVALTFDACEAPNAHAYLDRRLLAVLEKEELPFAMFATGLFARTNRDELARLAASPLVEIENHSYSHPAHMERLGPERIAKEVADADRVIAGITGRKPRFFRFPGGNHDAASLAEVEATGHTVVHWTFASGDPSKGLTPEHLEEWVLAKTRPGTILIFHINGRAPATSVALPRIVAALRAKGYRFVRLDELMK